MPHRPHPSRRALLGLCAAVPLLGGCAVVDRVTSFRLFGRDNPPPEVAAGSLTVERVRTGRMAPAETLAEEPGNVWPEAEGRRATMADPPRD